MAVSIIYSVVGEVPTEISTTEVKLPDSFSLAQFTTFGAAFATAMNNLIWGRILDATLVVDVDISALTGNIAAVQGDVEEVGAFEFVTAQGNRVKMNVPAIDELLTAADSHELDQADPAVAAAIAMMETGIAVTGGTIAPCDIGQDDIVDTIFAREQHRNSGKRVRN